ncbi:MAG: GTPase Era, partial [Bacteroidia bacterium]|nr:GTPase Era [Bacteroidia bacterium]
MHKSGFVNIIGKPNVGKSTLMNALVGESLSVITSKAQTTRHRILGIVNGENFQIIYSDTPGMIKPAYSLQKSMMNYVQGAFNDADIFLFVTQPGERDIDTEILSRLQGSIVPVVVALNKIDLSDQPGIVQEMEYWQEQLPKSKVIPVSALHKFNLTAVSDYLLEYLPESPPFYSKDELTDKPLRFFTSEIIRGEILKFYKKEIPYSCEVAITEYKEDKALDRITAVIFVTRES